MLQLLTIAAIYYNIVKKQFGEQQQLLEIQRSSQQSKLSKGLLIRGFVLLKTLGCGQFGLVYLCQFKNESSLFALKIMARSNIKQFGIAKHVANERRVQSNFRPSFYQAFFQIIQNQNNIYLLNEYIPEIELFDAKRDIELLYKNDLQFYISQMILQTEYLHTVHQIMSRAYIQENLMVDDTGYLGIPYYLASEVISGKGYNQMVDLWSVGVILYEFGCGGLPLVKLQKILLRFIRKSQRNHYLIHHICLIILPRILLNNCYVVYQNYIQEDHIKHQSNTHGLKIFNWML